MEWLTDKFSRKTKVDNRQKIGSFLDATEVLTVVILINATTLMHKSNLSTNNFGNNHFGQKYQRQNILRIFRRL